MLKMKANVILNKNVLIFKQYINKCSVITNTLPKLCILLIKLCPISEVKLFSIIVDHIVDNK